MMRRIDQILKIIDLHPRGVTTIQIYGIMHPDGMINQESRSRELSNIALRCWTLEKQGFIRHEQSGRSPVWFPIED